MRRLNWLGWLGVLAAFVALVVGSVAIDAAVRKCRLFSVDEDMYAAANRQVLATVPVYPGSQQINTGSIGEPAPKRCFNFENSGPYDSFRTFVNYQSPIGTTPAKTLAFYDRHFAGRGWARSETSPS